MSKSSEGTMLNVFVAALMVLTIVLMSAGCIFLRISNETVGSCSSYENAYVVEYTKA